MKNVFKAYLKGILPPSSFPSYLSPSLTLSPLSLFSFCFQILGIDFCCIVQGSMQLLA